MEDDGTVNIMIVLSRISSVPLQIIMSITNVTVIGMYMYMNKYVTVYMKTVPNHTGARIL